MALSINQVRKLKQGRAMVLLAVFLGLLYVAFSDGFNEIYPFINGAIAGFVAGLVIATLELGFFSGGLRKRRFMYILILRTSLYFFFLTLLILNVLIVSRMIRLNQSYAEVLSDSAFQHYVFKEDFPIVVVYAVVFAFSVNFTRMMSRKLGQGMLLSYITGTYRKPVTEERVVMFMKLQNSQGISEQLGSLNFYRFLNDFFYDITDSIIMHRGIIYEYVEDLIVVTWDINKGLANSNCIRSFFHALEELELKKEAYFTKYKVIPKPYAAFHSGKLIRAEIGDVKSEIALQGDVMNTTSRILKKCEDLKANLLGSAHLVLRLEFPLIYETNSKGKIKLRGKEEGVELFEIVEVTPKNAP